MLPPNSYFAEWAQPLSVALIFAIMISRLKIYIGDKANLVPSECVKNWDEVACTLERKDYSGVTRSFTSQFEFVGSVKELLLSLYEADGFNAKAEIAVETICIRADQTIKKGNRKTSIAFFNFLWRNIRISPLKKQSVSYVRDDDELPIRGGRLL